MQDSRPTLNIVERAYKRLNSIGGKQISGGEWVGLLSAGLAMVAQDLLRYRYPARFVAPAVMFLVFTASIAIQRPADWRRQLFVIVCGCVVFGVFLTITAHLAVSWR